MIEILVVHQCGAGGSSAVEKTLEAHVIQRAIIKPGGLRC
jgi:hypothetical protein